MKIRNGFVSNSSSSSFVIVSSKENFDKIYNDADENVKALIDEIRITERSICDNDMIVLGWMNIMDNSPWDDYDDYVLVDNFLSKLKINKKECFALAIGDS
jgi:hypothetical protein